MSVKRVDFLNFNFSIGVDQPYKPTIRKEYVENSGLNIYHPKLGNPIVEELMEQVVSKRCIPLNDGIETLYAIKNKVPFLAQYIDGCIDILLSYKMKI
ncbi:hypothetical protein J6I39_00515 [bacterium]|nr:hypothetical protein [bacterium]